MITLKIMKIFANFKYNVLEHFQGKAPNINSFGEKLITKFKTK